MFDWVGVNSYKDKNILETCDYCGCVFRMENQLQDGHNEHEEYHCPECGKEYSIRASLSPRVTLITKRTDGKTDLYNNNR